MHVLQLQEPDAGTSQKQIRALLSLASTTHQIDLQAKMKRNEQAENVKRDPQLLAKVAAGLVSQGGESRQDDARRQRLRIPNVCGDLGQMTLQKSKPKGKQQRLRAQWLDSQRPNACVATGSRSGCSVGGSSRCRGGYHNNLGVKTLPERSVKAARAGSRSSTNPAESELDAGRSEGCPRRCFAQTRKRGPETERQRD